MESLDNSAVSQKVQFGEALKIARKRVGLSQERAARAGNVSTAAWQSWEQGVNAPMLESAGAIVRALGLEAVFIFEWMGFTAAQSRKLAEALYETRERRGGLK